MVRGIDIQNVVANTQHVAREQQINLQQPNVAASQAAQEGKKHEEEAKEKIAESRQTEQEHQAIDTNKERTKGRRWRRGSGPARRGKKLKPDESVGSDGERHIIDVKA